MPFRPRLQKRSRSNGGQGGRFNAFFCREDDGKLVVAVIQAINDGIAMKWDLADSIVSLTFVSRPGRVSGLPKIVVVKGENSRDVHFPPAPIRRSQITLDPVGGGKMVGLGSSQNAATALLAALHRSYQWTCLPQRSA